MIQLLLNKTTPHFQLLPMSKVDQSSSNIHEAPPLQLTKSQRIFELTTVNPYILRVFLFGNIGGLSKNRQNMRPRNTVSNSVTQ